MENEDYFNGAVRLNPILFTINCILIVHFILSWYISYKKTGWAIDPWNLSLLFLYFLPFLLMYPFSSAYFNVMSVGTGKIRQVQSTINPAYFIALVGYLSIFAGSAIFKQYKYNSIVNKIFIRPFRVTAGELFRSVIVNRKVCHFMFYCYLATLMFMLAMAFKAGSINNPRSYFYRDDQIRVIYNFTTTLSSMVSLVIIVRIFQFNKLLDKIYFGVFVLATLFIGARGYALGPLVTVFTYVVYFEWKGRIRIRKTILFALIGVWLLSVVTFFRAGTSHSASFLMETFYGNSFSDLRDFSWVLSAWDGTFLLGKTYLAAFMSFIPSSFSSFRTEWSIGKITAILGGFDPKEHPGLRPGLFGESYLNFGIIGVIILGTATGYMYRMIDYTVKYYAYTNNKIEVFITSVAGMFIGNLSITSGFFSIYVFLVVFSLLNVLRLFLNVYKKNNA